MQYVGVLASVFRLTDSNFFSIIFFNWKPGHCCPSTIETSMLVATFDGDV